MKLSPVLLLLCPFLISACGEKTPAPGSGQAQPPLVKALTIGDGGTSGEILEQRYSGEVRARIETTLGFRIGGKLVERRVDAGTRVTPGQVLARLDPGDQQLAIAQAEATRQLAAAELKRTQELRERNFISAAALDAKESAARAAEAQAHLARNQASYTTLVADAPGVIAAVLAEPGQVVTAGQGVLRLARDGEREVAIAIPETRFAGLKVGMAATVRLWAGANEKTYAGILRELSPVADPATRTFAARVSLRDADPGVALGMTANVSFAATPGGQIIVPLAALLQRADGQAGTAVWVIGADGVIHQRPVEVARYADAGAIIASGLATGETIVAAGAFKLVEGETVRIAPSAAP